LEGAAVPDINQALESASRRCGKPTEPYGFHTCPDFWREVFAVYYGEQPAGDNDPGWKELFSYGYPALRRMLNEAPAE